MYLFLFSSFFLIFLHFLHVSYFFIFSLVGMLVGDTGDVEARSGTPRVELEPAGRGHRSQRHAAVGALIMSSPRGSKMFERKKASALARSTDSLSMPHDGCTSFT